MNTGQITTLTATVGSVDPVCYELHLYTGTVNEFGKELPIILPFDDIMEIQSITTA